jgi:hypothetical protein
MRSEFAQVSVARTVLGLVGLPAQRVGLLPQGARTKGSGLILVPLHVTDNADRDIAGLVPAVGDVKFPAHVRSPR